MMFKTLNLNAVLLTLLSILFLAACGTSDQPPFVTEDIEEQAQPTQTKEINTPTLQLPTFTSAPPTSTSIPPTPTTAPIGFTRTNPYPATDIISVSGWDIQLLEVIRGDSAWIAVKNANMFNVAPPQGMEYILLKIRVRCTYSDNDEHLLDKYDFGVTGSKLVRYSAGMVTVVEPEPDLSAKLYSGGEVEGWASYLIFKDDQNLTLIFDENESTDDTSEIRYFAIDEKASISTPPDLDSIPSTKTGLSRQNPLSKSEKLITEDWEISVSTDLRGQDAWTLIQDASSYNDPPPDGYEYVALKLKVRYIGSNEHGAKVDTYFLNLTGSSANVFASPFLQEPFPPLSMTLYPGGEHEGWVVFLSLVGETNLMLMLNESFSFDSEIIRFIALDEGASVAMPANLADLHPNELGIMRTAPAALNEIVISEDWEISVLEVMRGADALLMVQKAGTYNPVPSSGMEYIAARVRLRYIGTAELAVSIDGYFSSVGDTGVVYDLPYIFNLERMLTGSLFPGGEMEGWIILQAGIGENNMTLIFKPMFDFTDVNKRFLMLERR